LCFTNSFTTVASGGAFVTALNPPSILLGGINTILNHGITSPHRVIGAGFQVTNTTAALYRSGNVVVFDTPSNWTTVSYAANATDVPVATTQFVYGQVSAKMIQGPPVTLGQAIQMGGAKQFSAEEGCYCVSKFSSLDNPVTGVAIGRGVNQSNNLDERIVIGYPATVDMALTPVQNGDVTLGTQLLGVPSGPGNYLSYPFNGCGAIFTGLDPNNASLQVTAKWYIEVFPNPLFDPTLLPIVTPSARYDPLALEVYASVVSQLPGGVPVKDNFLGMIGSAIGGLASSALGGLTGQMKENARHAAGASAAELQLRDHWRDNSIKPLAQQEWERLRAEYGDASRIVHEGGGTPHRGVVAFFHNAAKKNLELKMPMRSGNSAQDIEFNYPFWFGDGNYPKDNASSVPTPDYAQFSADAHVCNNCAMQKPQTMQMSVAPMSDPYYNYGRFIGPDALSGVPFGSSGNISSVIQSAVDKALGNAMKKMTFTSMTPGLPGVQLVRPTTQYEELEDYPEASEAVKARRRVARRNRTARLAQCRVAMPEIFPAPRPALRSAAKALPG
jgi:hypothetical protein